MADTCQRCGERPAAPGKFGRRCSTCIEAIARPKPDDCNAAMVTLSGVPAVVSVELVDPVYHKHGFDPTLELVLGSEQGRVSPRVLRILASYDLGVVDVTPQGEPAQLVATAR